MLPGSTSENICLRRIVEERFKGRKKEAKDRVKE